MRKWVQPDEITRYLPIDFDEDAGSDLDMAHVNNYQHIKVMRRNLSATADPGDPRRTNVTDGINYFDALLIPKKKYRHWSPSDSYYDLRMSASDSTIKEFYNGDNLHDVSVNLDTNNNIINERGYLK